MTPEEKDRETAREIILIGGEVRLRGYKLCPECGQPMLKKGQRRKHPDDYRHASGCSNEETDGACKYSRRVITAGGQPKQVGGRKVPKALKELEGK